jgi:hypothetical protein
MHVPPVKAPFTCGPANPAATGRCRHLHLRRLIVLAVALAGSGVVWQQFLRDRLLPKRWQTVYAGRLYRSGQLSQALVRRVLETHGIRVVVDLTSRDPNVPDQDGELAACDALGIEHARFPLEGDGTGDVGEYAAALARIHEAVERGEPVLVHCAAGVQRTGGVIAAYQLLVRREPPATVYRELTEDGMGRYPVNPTVPAYLNDHMQEIADRLVQLGTLDAVPSPLPLLPEAEAEN